MSIQAIKPVDQFTSATTLVIKQNYITSDYCCCCWSVNGKYYEIRTTEEDKDPPLFRADEDPGKPSISITDPDGLMFVQLFGSGHCQCGAIPVWHRKIDVHCTPGQLVGSIHYSTPSTMLMKNGDGEPIFRLIRQSPPIYTNPLKRAWVDFGEDPKFQVFSVNPDFPDALTTISRKGRNYTTYGSQGFNIVMNLDESLDVEAKAMMLGAAFPIGLEYYEGSVFDQDQYGMPMSPRNSLHRTSLHRTSETTFS